MLRSRFDLWWTLVHALSLALVACFTACASPASEPEELGTITSAATVVSDFSEGQYASGLLNPTTMAFAPDGRLFVCEQAGRLRVIDASGTLLSTPFVTLSVPTAGEQGLVGITFDPSFESNHFVYVYYTLTTPTMHNRLSRFTANGNVAIAGSEVVLYEGGTTQSTIHNGGALHFGPDGKLYVAVGEDATGHYAQELTNTWGKILRFNADGTIPSDNPFFATTSGTNRAIWALGLRNPFTFDIRRTTGRMFINDVGQSTWEEVNDGVAGANYGWPVAEGPSSDPLYRSPIHAYMHGGSDTSGCAITGGAFYDPPTPQFPSSYVGDYFYADYCSGWIRRLDVSGATVTSHPFLQGANQPLDIDVGPDGALYYLNRGDGSVHRVTYAPAGAPPAILTPPASITVAPGQAATFSVATSGSSPLSFQWQRDGVNIVGATGTSYTLSATALTDSGASFRVVVTNPFGTATSPAARLTVTTDTAPTLSIVSPAASTIYAAGQVITFSGTANDAEDGALPASAFTWRVMFHHDQHTHPFLDDTSGVTSGTFEIPVYGHTETNVWYRIHLSVRDSAGHVVSTFRDIQPLVVPITLATNPAGMSVALDGTPRAGGYSEASVAGVRRTLSAPSVQSLGGVLYAFQSWSDGGAQSHEISTPTTATTYTATYARVTGGLSGQYFNEADLTASVLTRSDPRIDFDFGQTSPAPGVAPESYSVRWSGQIVPRHSETYTFYTLSDDGVRLWINNVLVVDNWTNHGPTENSGTIALTAGVPVPIRLEYYNIWGGAVIRLSWESASQAREIVPQQQLREPGSSEPPPPPPGEAAAIVTPPASASVAPGQPATFSVTASGTPSLTYQWQRDGVSIPGANASSYTLASATLADSGASFRVVVANAFGTATSPAATLTVTADGASGLRGEYFNEMNLTAPVLTRSDARIDFDFGQTSPVPGVAAETYSIRWTGQVVPRHSETYTFYTLSDDGVRLWINDVLVVDNWTDHGPTENSGTIALTAGVPVAIRLEFYNIWGGAVIRLSWSSASQAREIIPQSQLLLPGGTPPPPPPPPPPGQAPTIVTPPANVTVAPAQATTFSVTASGTAPLSYQWQRNGTDIVGASAATYTLASPGSADSGATFRVIVSNSYGSVTSAAATLTVSGSTGSGLRGEYFDEMDLTALALARTDAQVDFDFGQSSPVAGVGPETYSVRWTGRVVPRHSQTYTFYTLSDDGVRLWVNDVLLVDNWTNHGPTENSGTIALTAGVPASIRLEFYNIWGGAVIRLSWSSASQAREVVPQSQLLLPGSTPPPPPPPPPPPGSFSLTIDSVSTNKAYTVGTIAVGSLIYIDRTYTVSTLSPALVGASYVRSANDDKNLTSATHLSFTLGAASTVYVAYDARGTLPNWLRTGWELTTLSFVGTDASGTLTRRVYRRTYPAGQVTLGGNVQPPGSGAGVHYVVLAQPQ